MGKPLASVADRRTERAAGAFHKRWACYRSAMPRRRPTALDVILCIALFTLVMGALSWVLHQTVPGGMRWAYGAFGRTTVLGVMAALFCVGAYFAWWPLFRDWLAKRRGASVRKDQ
ncbi:hypothetical protein FHR71_001147 [Methylobacterium sp. RAS18]|nr:hypothetical protein [Methylobacterium sp. RAS18]